MWKSLNSFRCFPNKDTPNTHNVRESKSHKRDTWQGQVDVGRVREWEQTSELDRRYRISASVSERMRAKEKKLWGTFDTHHFRYLSTDRKRKSWGNSVKERGRVQKLQCCIKMTVNKLWVITKVFQRTAKKSWRKEVQADRESVGLRTFHNVKDGLTTDNSGGLQQLQLRQLQQQYKQALCSSVESLTLSTPCHG